MTETFTCYADNRDDVGYSATYHIMHAYCVAYCPPANPIAVQDSEMAWFTPDGWQNSFVASTNHVG